MSNVVNLNRFRKNRKRDEKQKRAEENRIKFGRTKQQKHSDVKNAEKAADHLDNHKLEDDES